VSEKFKILAQKWPSAIVARSEVGKFSGGLLNPRTMANYDSAGVGPKKIKFGKKVGYSAEDLIAWMETRLVSDESEP